MDVFLFDEIFYKAGGEFGFKKDEFEAMFFKTLMDDCGYLLVKGFPINDDDVLIDLEKQVLSFSFLLGVPLSQNRQNEFICRVQDEKKSIDHPDTRGYQNSAALPFHTDRCDLLMLLGVRPSATGGGETLVVSSKTIRQQVETRYPEMYSVLKEPFPFEKRGEDLKNTKPWYMVPIFSELGDEHLLHWYCRAYVKNSQKYDDCPKLSPVQVDALDVLDSVIQRCQHTEPVHLNRGDVLLLNSHTTLHARNGFPMDSGRLLLRVWLANRATPELPDHYKSIFGNVAKGSYRGGVWSCDLNLDVIPQDLAPAKAYIKTKLERAATAGQ